MKGADFGPARDLFFSVHGAVCFVIGHVSFGSLFFSFHFAVSVLFCPGACADSVLCAFGFGSCCLC